MRWCGVLLCWQTSNINMQFKPLGFFVAPLLQYKSKCVLSFDTRVLNSNWNGNCLCQGVGNSEALAATLGLGNLPKLRVAPRRAQVLQASTRTSYKRKLIGQHGQTKRDSQTSSNGFGKLLAATLKLECLLLLQPPCRMLQGVG